MALSLQAEFASEVDNEHMAINKFMSLWTAKKHTQNY